ncbi:hypothetical protein LR48_Vigan05g102500 [Vigna angularis]|uniref:Uncharacterized protein n=1 Tax=Phaseolus angularis TaxID=3914 RepID=A0A0L9UL49_PHAAN|nr:hypothetical protein LR48_Vigan05g102500 [Vigna angularis]
MQILTLNIGFGYTKTEAYNVIYLSPYSTRCGIDLLPRFRQNQGLYNPAAQSKNPEKPLGSLTTHYCLGSPSNRSLYTPAVIRLQTQTAKLLPRFAQQLKRKRPPIASYLGCMSNRGSISISYFQIAQNLHFRRQLLLLPRTLFFLHFPRAEPPVPLLDSSRHRFATSFLAGFRPCSATTRRRFWASLLPSPSRHWCLAGATSATTAASARAFSAALPWFWPRLLHSPSRHRWPAGASSATVASAGTASNTVSILLSALRLVHCVFADNNWWRLKEKQIV